MNCRECQDLIHRFLDGEDVLRDADLQAHLDACAVCRRELAAARTLVGGLRTLPRPMPSVSLAPALVTAVQQDRVVRRRRSVRRWYATAALAASLLLAIGFGHVVAPWRSVGPSPSVRIGDGGPAPVPSPEIRPEPAQLAERAGDATKAVASLTRSVAEKTRVNLELILAAANPLDEATLPTLPEFEEPLDPAAQSLRNAGLSVAQTLEPMAQSARQAFAYLAREMPAFDLAVDP